MKKTLITIILTILLSVGAFASADIVSAEETSVIPLGYSVVRRNDSTLEFTVSMENLEKAIIEYSFYRNEILMSKLLEVDISHEYCIFGTDQNVYAMNLPEEALSVIVWRVITDSEEIKSLSGSFEYEESPETAISEVEARLKTIYVENDLITKELGLTSIGGIVAANSYTFKMYFNLEDIDSNRIPIDEIYSLEVEYDIKYKYLGFINGSSEHVVKSIVATEQRNATYWPFIIPESVKTNIETSGELEYDWVVNLGTYRDADGVLPLSDVTLDQTTILTISYFYNGVFYDSETVVDEPYDSSDIIDVIPGTIDPITSIIDKVIDSIGNLGSTLSVILAVLLVILLIAGIILFKSLVKTIIGILKAVWWSLKAVYLFVRFVVYIIPKTLIKAIVFLFIPKTKRKERYNASRYI
ncbi:MAG: hypothetical protein JEZ05_06350 [Tenericutes bacterium]|nr:hypothetical protein [Mycoplasmatota bacterium]